MSDVMITTTIEIAGDDVGSIDVPVVAWSSLEFYRGGSARLEYEVLVNAIEIGGAYANSNEAVYYWLGKEAARRLYDSIDELSYEAA